jgi:hypothetical protein
MIKKKIILLIFLLSSFVIICLPSRILIGNHLLGNFYINKHKSSYHLQKQNPSFYVVAHQDDWQIFMGVNAYNDILNQNAKTVFIYITAGDEGSGSGFGKCTNCTMPHFRSREEGAISSVKLVANQSWPYSQMTEDTFYVNNRNFFIHKYIYSNTISYFIRLPNRSTAPNLYTFFYGKDSLTTLVDSTEKPLKDHLNTFHNKGELIELVKKIFIKETGALTSLWINTPDTDSLKENPVDHIEHYITGNICRSAAALIGNSKEIYLAYYKEYCTENMPHNLSTDGAIIESGLLAAYNKSKIDAGWWSEWNGCKKWCSSNYLRVVVSGNANASEKSTSNYFRPDNSYAIDCLPEDDPSLLKINYSVPENNDAVDLEFINSKMEIVAKIAEALKKGKFSTHFNISKYPEGIYFFRLRLRNHSESEVYTTFKIFINK